VDSLVFPFFCFPSYKGILERALHAILNFFSQVAFLLRS
jgi:hypothetical protein